MLAALQPYLPYILGALYVGIQNFIAHNESIQGNTLEAVVINSIASMLKSLVGKNPPPPVA